MSLPKICTCPTVPAADCPFHHQDACGSLAAMPCSGWVGRLSHDRSKHADWGWLRDESGELIVIVKMPFMEDEELHEHRRNGTDPAQERVDAILSALYVQNASDQ